MKKITLMISILLISFATLAQTTWKADPYHSRLGFSVTHLGISDVPGHFNTFDVTITASEENFSDAVVELTAQVSSIDTRVEPRDKHLRSADFFNVEEFPTMHFESTEIKKAGRNKYKLTGNLIAHGVTRSVTLTMHYRGTTANPNAGGAPVAGIQITGSINRSDFGIGDSFPASMISDEVLIKADGEFGNI